MGQIGKMFAMVLALLGPQSTDAPQQLQLKQGDTIVAIGDSITQQGGYVRDIDAVLAQQYPELKLAPVVNKGIGGQKAEDLVARFDNDVIKLKPACVTLSIGINDVCHRLGKPHDEEVLAAYRANVAKMVDMAQQAGIQVILLTPTVISEDPGSEGNRRLAAYVEAQRQIAAEKKCRLVDLHAMFLTALTHKPADKDTWLTTDGVHMSPMGDAVMAVGVLRALGVPDAKIAASLEDAARWTPVVQGDSLKGCFVLIAGQEKNVDPDHVFSVKDGVIHAYRDAPDGQKMPFGGIITDKEYSRFHLRLEFKWGTKKFAPRYQLPRDGGILYHVTQPNRIWPQGVECQIQEGDVGDLYVVYSAATTTIDPKTMDAVDPAFKLRSPVFMEAADGGAPLTQNSEGSEAGVVRVRRSQDWEHDGWNTVEVLVDGDRSVHLVNGHINNRCYKMCRSDPDKPDRTIPLTQGRILLQAEGAEIFYRNIAIKDLSESEQVLLDPKPF